MNRLQVVRTTGVLFILFSLLLNVPYYLLIQNFEYDDILRKPTDYVLTQFHAGGAGLILTWFSFALVALLFIPASVLFQKVLRREDTPYLSAATSMGVLSGVVQYTLVNKRLLGNETALTQKGYFYGSSCWRSRS